MLKKMLLAATVVMALAAVASPSAPAAWTQNHEPIKVDATETFTGDFLQQTQTYGQVTCTNAELVIQMLAGQTKGTVTKLTCSNPTTNAHVTGPFAALCGGTTILHKMELTEHATAEVVTNAAAVPAITITNVNLYTAFTNGTHQQICVEFHLTSGAGKGLVGTPKTAQTINHIQLTGSLNLAPGIGFPILGTLFPHKANTYGIVAP